MAPLSPAPSFHFHHLHATQNLNYDLCTVFLSTFISTILHTNDMELNTCNTDIK